MSGQFIRKAYHKCFYRKYFLQAVCIFCVCLLLSGLFIPYAEAATPLQITVIGDSIAKGIGSSNMETSSYGALISGKLNGECTNLGISGLDSGQLIKKLETDKFQETISQSDVIFLSIGSNDLLKPFVKTIGDTLGVSQTKSSDDYKAFGEQLSEAMSGRSDLALVNLLSTAVKKLTNNKELNQACSEFKKNINKIIKLIKKENPDAVIYLNNIYNPYYGVAYDLNGISLLNIYQLCEPYINKMNDAYELDSKDYFLVDVYTIFRQEGYTNVRKGSLKNMSSASFDPHPNDKGYRMMADYIYTQMDSVLPTAKLLDTNEKYSVDSGTVTISFSEKIRPIEGKKLYLRSQKEEFTCLIDKDASVSYESEKGYFLKVPISKWLENDSKNCLCYDSEYQLVAEAGAFHDKGNNSLAEEVIGLLQTEQEPQTKQVNAKAKNFSFTGKSRVLVGVVTAAAVVLLVVAVAIYKTRCKKRKNNI